MPCFKIEIGSDFPDGSLPTLDTRIWVAKGPRVEYRFYEKPMASNRVVTNKSAMGENGKMASLSQDLVRRMLATSESLGDQVRVNVVDEYGTKLRNSGYSLEKSRNIIIAGLKFYEKKVK